MWTPGVSTGSLNVTTVFLFHSSAFTLGENAAAMMAAINTLGAALNKVIRYSFSKLESCEGNPTRRPEAFVGPFASKPKKNGPSIVSTQRGAHAEGTWMTACCHL